MWLQSGRSDAVARRMYDEAMDAIVRNIIQTSAGGLTYASDMKYERLEHKMDHLACFAGWYLQFCHIALNRQHTALNRKHTASNRHYNAISVLSLYRWIVLIGCSYSG